MSKYAFVTGGHGFLGRHLVKRLLSEGYKVAAPPRSECDLLVDGGFYSQLVKLPQVDVLYHLAADVGGIEYNQFNPGRLGYNNLQMGLNVFESARRCEVKHLVFAGTVCSYPQFPQLPMVEGSLWAGYPEPSNGSYGVAKRTLMDLLGAYHQQYGLSYSAPVLANLYGPGDTYKPGKSHVISDLFYKFMVAKEKSESSVEVWGNGNATRDFLFVQDAVEALVLAGKRESVGEVYNIASGEETTIYSLAHTIKQIIGFDGGIVWGVGKPTGQERRAFQLYRVKKILGWEPKVKLEEGLKLYYNWLQGGKCDGSK